MQSGSLRSTLERGRAIRKEIRRAGALAAGRPAKRAGARSCPLATACVRLRPLAPAMPRAFSRRRPFVACHRGPRRATHASAMPMRGAPRRMPTRRRRPDASITRHSPSAERQAPSAERRAPSAERRAPSAERRAPSAERRAPSAERQAPSAKRQAPSAKRQAPSAKRQAPSAKRQAPSADRTSIVVIRSLLRACAASPPPSARRLPATQRSGRALCDGRAATRVAPVARLRVLPNLVDSESAQAT
ncbi:50S ribosomal protein L19 [Burkholderia pseudomallei]|nr:50S ribosomal protein L19 [Burkholderia pseudomallei]CAJ3758971.1 50S ribosomal protein L19 [Burkholderia pseudomallei]CAJ4749115.1 50S ribosomal protein L19 [Burkholderia pseudomallei]CAJ4803588.1 50S ribosomal protein L19 [Burkholderia pseudomallei]CAJ4905423.1 50S ribosomal protein L19 [Burkholderia pseudomallei]